MNIEKIDKIVVNHNELVKMGDWVREQNFKGMNIPMNEVFLIINNMEGFGLTKSIGLYFLADEKTSEISLKLFDMSDMFMLLSIKIGDEYFTNQKFEVVSKGIRVDEISLQKTSEIMVMMIFDVFQYMTNRVDHLIVTQETKNVKKSLKNKKKSNNSKTRYVKIKTTRYTFNFEGGEEGDKRDYERHTPSWSVRGHWRYMKKTGKRIWVKGHVKGKGETQAKTYTF